MRHFNFVVYNFMEHFQYSFYSAFLKGWPTEGMHNVCDTACIVRSAVYICAAYLLDFSKLYIFSNV